MPLIAALLLVQGAQTSSEALVVPLASLVPPASLSIRQVQATRPLYAGLRLQIETPDKPSVEVKKPADLVGKVKIDSAEDALEYVRLLRTPGIWPFLFRQPVLEVRRSPVLFRVPALVYDDLRIFTISGWDGVVDAADWARLGFPEPKIEGGGGKDWTIRRPCLTKEGENYRTGTLVERVSEAGRYGFSIERPEDALRRVRWHITIPASR